MTTTTAPSSGTLPETGYLRLKQIIPDLVPVSAATWWRWVADGRAPQGKRLSPGVTAWRAEDLRAWMASQ